MDSLDVEESDPRCTHQQVVIKELGFYDHMAAEKEQKGTETAWKEVTKWLDSEWWRETKIGSNSRFDTRSVPCLKLIIVEHLHT